MGDDDPSTLNVMNNLALLLIRMKNHDEGLPLLVETFPSAAPYWERIHPHTLDTMNNVADVIGIMLT